MRVLLVGNVLLPAHMEVWRQTVLRDVDLAMIGTTSRYGCPLYPPARLRAPDWGRTYVDVPVGWRSRGHLFWVYPRLPAILRQERPDLVHVIGEPWGLLVVESLALAGAVTVHGSTDIYGQDATPEGAVVRGIYRRTLPRLAGFAAPNRGAVAAAVRNGLRPGVPTVVAQHLVVDPAPFLEAGSSAEVHRDRWGWRDRIVVGFVGRLVPEKGADRLIEAVQRLGGAGAEARVALFGDGPDRQRLMRMAQDVDVPVEFRGEVPVRDVPSVMAGLDILVVPSRTTPDWVEYFGRVAVEAMFAGTPVIATDCGYLPEVVGEGGVVIPEDRADLLSEALARLICDPGERRDVGRRGATWALEHHHPSVIAERIVGFWRTATSRVR